MTEALALQQMVDPSAAEPNLYAHCRTSIKEGASTKLEAVAVDAIRLGGMQRSLLISNAMQDFAKVTQNASVKSSIHPTLYLVLKQKAKPSADTSPATVS